MICKPDDLNSITEAHLKRLYKLFFVLHMCAVACMHVHTHTHTCTNAHTHTHANACTHTNKHI